MKNDKISDINKLSLKKRNNYQLLDINEYSDENKFLNSVGEFLKNDTDILHIIPSASSDNLTVDWVKKVRELCSIYNCLLIIHNRLDIARVTDSDGIFFDEKGIPIKDIKDISEGIIIGTSQENCELADYILTEKNKITVL